MIIKMKKGAEIGEKKHVVEILEKKGFQIKEIIGVEYGVLGVVGDTAKVDVRDVEALAGVQKVTRIQEPFKQANRAFREEDTVIEVGDVRIGGGNFTIMAGPCSVENREQITEVARAVSKSGAQILRGGAYKPRTSPYAFQGMEGDGLELLKEARKDTGMPIVTELMAPSLVGKFEDDVDIIQIGARNMQNFDLLKAVGRTRKPVLLKRGMSATIEEWLMAAEYIMSEGNPNVILCERGIRTFETYTRYTLDISTVPVIKELSHLPIIVDPSHPAGNSKYVPSLARAAIAAGADGLLIEVHSKPSQALSDGKQSVKPMVFKKLMDDLKNIAKVVGRKI